MLRSLYLACACIGIISSFYFQQLNTIYYLIITLTMIAISIRIAQLTYPLSQHQRTRNNTLILCLFIYSIGLAYSTLRTHISLQQQWPANNYPTSIPLQIQITGLPETYPDGMTRFLAQATTENGKTFHLLLSDYQQRLWNVGEHWQIQARVRASIGNRNPVGFDREAWALSQQIDGVGTIGLKRKLIKPAQSGFNQHFINQIRQKIQQQWHQSSQQHSLGKGLMLALAIGDRSGLPQEAWAAFRPLGLNHLVSISGLHITLFAIMATIICKQLMHYLPFTPKRPRVWYLTTGMIAATFYTALAGWEIPALRSLIMLSVFSIFWIRKGTIGSWQTWWLALLIILIYQPTATLNIGFWLSFGLIATLIWVLSYRLQPKQKNWLTQIKQAIQAQYAASLISWLATIFLFGLLSIFSPLINLIAIPFFSWVLVPIALISSCLPFETIQYYASWFAEQTMKTIMLLSQWLPEIPFPQIPIPLILLSIIATLLLLLPIEKRVKYLCTNILICLLLYKPQSSKHPLEITIWDVGQGLSILINTPNQTLLFDTGTSSATNLSLLPNLRAIGIKQLDHLILSHHDNDHDGGWQELQKHFIIKTLWAGQPEYYPKAKHCRQNTQWQINDIVFEFLTPNTQISNHDNELSCVLRVIAHGQAILIMGDLGKSGENKLIKQYNKQLFSQILVLGHHGSVSSSSSSFIHHVSPTWAVASSGYANAFKHPHPTVQNTLSAHQVKLLRTDTQGMIHFSISEQGITLHPPLNKYWWQKKPFTDY